MEMKVEMGTLKTPKAEVLLCPFPFQGHVTPMLQLGSLLHSRGCFSIVLVHTTFNFPDHSILPSEFTLLPLHVDGSFHGASGNPSSIIRKASDINEGCRAALEEVIMRRRRELACVVYDPLWNFVGAVAEKMKLPTMAIRGTSPGYVHSVTLLLRLAHQRVFPLPESELKVSIDPKQQHPLRFKDLPMPPTEEIPRDFLDHQHKIMDVLKASSAIIWNTTEELEGCTLRLLQHHLPLPFFSIGPLHKMAPPLTTNVLQEDTRCLSWLDKHPPNSVVYVSLGSLATIEETELEELAQGLAKSQQPFLWAIRPTLLNDGRNAIDSLPKGFKDVITCGKGCLVEWAPQKRVLAHQAIGGFISHCGWNSTLESMCEGVPLICRPCFADQMVNARYVAHVWKVGVELENGKASGIEKGIRYLIVSEEGKGIRREAHRMKQVLEDSINGGSSCKSLNEMVEFIISLGTKERDKVGMYVDPSS